MVPDERFNLILVDYHKSHYHKKQTKSVRNTPSRNYQK